MKSYLIQLTNLKARLTLVNCSIFEDELVYELQPLALRSRLQVAQERVVSKEELSAPIYSSILLAISNSTVAVVSVLVFIAQFFLQNNSQKG